MWRGCAAEGRACHGAGACCRRLAKQWGHVEMEGDERSTREGGAHGETEKKAAPRDTLTPLMLSVSV